MEKIVKILLKVENWEALANQLDINYYTIQTNCQRSSLDLASCFRRKVVETHCERQRSENLRKVVQDIAHILKKEMGKWRVGQELEEAFLIGE